MNTTMNSLNLVEEQQGKYIDTNTQPVANPSLMTAMNVRVEYLNQGNEGRILIELNEGEEVKDQSFQEIAFQFESKLKEIINEEGVPIYGGIGIIQCREEGIALIYEFVKGRKPHNHKEAALSSNFFWMELDDKEYYRPKDGLEVKANASGEWIVSYKDIAYEFNVKALNVEADSLRQLMNNNYALIEGRIGSILKGVQTKSSNNYNPPIVEDNLTATLQHVS